MSLLRLAPPVAVVVVPPPTAKTPTLSPIFSPRYLPRFSISRITLATTPTTAAKASAPAASSSPPPGTVQVADLVERDWSFLEPRSPTDPIRSEKIDRIIRSARVGSDSKVLVSLGSVYFIDRLVESNRLGLVVAVHESLMSLALVKERHDAVRCWQGGVDAAPARFGPFDAVFAYYFPGMGVSVDQLLGTVAPSCAKGARVVISYDEGREVIEQDHRRLYPDVVNFDLPSRTALEKATTEHPFEIVEFTDEPKLYLAVLAFTK